MKTVTINVFRYDELNEKAQRRADDWFRRDIEPLYYEADLQEGMNSLKSLFDHAGVELADYSIGGFNSYSRPRFAHDGQESLHGPRAIAWIENNILSPLRATRSTRYCKVGHVPSCPFTGVFYDDLLLDSLTDNVRSGLWLFDCFYNLGATLSRSIDDITYTPGEHLEHYWFTENGEPFI